MARAAAPALVGRSAELARLTGALPGAGAGVGPPLFVLVGEAGVGKTRCLSAFLDGAGRGGATVVLGHCPPVSGAELPFAAVADALRRLSRQAPGRLATWLGTAPSALVRLAPDLAGTFPDTVDPAAPEGGPVSRIFAEVLGMLRRMAGQAPVVLAIEDVHWADRSTRDLLGLLIRAIADLPVLVVLTCRGDELAPADPVLAWLADLARARPMERVELPRLRREELDQLLTHLLGAAPEPAVARRIFARSEGNPFIAEELLAATGGELPATVRDAVLGRMARLPAPAQRLVRAAAVLASSGTEVPHALLATVLDTPDGEDLVAAARAGVAAHLLRTTGTGYAFRHALTREAVESDLLPVERERLNAAAANALGDGPDPVTSARVAYHWHAAGDAERALAAAVTAGLAARASYAFAAAQELFERAITLWPRVDEPGRGAGVDEAGLYELTAEAIYLNRHERGAVELAARALALLDPGAEPERAARLHLLAGAAQWSYTGDARAALARADTALELLPEPHPTGAHARAARARYLLLLDRDAECAAAAVDAGRLARAAGVPAAEASALVSLGAAHDLLGREPDAIECITAGRRIAEEIGDGESLGRSYVNLACCHERRGRTDAMLDEVRAGERAVSRFGLDHTVGVALHAMAAVRLTEAGRWAEADEFTAGYRDVDGNLRVRMFHALVLLYTGRGRFADAEALLAELRRLLATSTEPQVLEPVYAVAAELALWRGDAGAAREAVHSGLECLAPPRTHRLRWLGLRAEADAGAADAATVEALLGLPCPVRVAPEAAYLSLARAETTRLERRADPATWDEAAALCSGTGAHYLAGYPRLRAGEAYLARGDRTTARARLRDVAALADRLGAVPLRDSVTDLARRARLGLGGDPPRRRERPGGLTDRETEVLALVATGLTNRDIAQRLFISEHTVGVHVSRVLTKLGARRRTEAVAIGRSTGILPLTGRLR